MVIQNTIILRKYAAAFAAFVKNVKAKRRAMEERASIEIQKVGRGYAVRRRRERARRDRAATQIEKVARGFIARRQTPKLRVAKRRDSAATGIQKIWRGALGRQEAHRRKEEQIQVTAEAQAAREGLKRKPDGIDGKQPQFPW